MQSDTDMRYPAKKTTLVFFYEDQIIQYEDCYLYASSFFQCCHKSAPARPEYAIVALGLTNAGKSTLLAILANEETSDIEPTQGWYTITQSIT